MNIRTWIKISTILLITNFFLVIFLINLNTREKTIVVPSDFKKEFWIQGDQVSPLYVEQMSNYFFQLLLTYNKQNVLNQYKTILHYVEPARYGKMQSFLLSDADRIQRNELGSVFYPMGIKVSGMMAEMDGEHLGLVGSQIISRKMKKFRMILNYMNGQLNINSFEEINQGNKR